MFYDVSSLTGESCPSGNPDPEPPLLLAPRQFSPVWGLLLLLIIAAVLYARTLGFSFVYDDTSQIAQNPTIRSWSYLPQYFTQHVWGYSNVWTNLYRPVFLICLRICHVLFGVEPSGWHAFAVFVHLVNICLVFLVIRKLLRKQDQSDWIALTAAAIFAVHPVQLETIAWISGMTDALMAVPLLLGFWCYLEWRSYCALEVARLLRRFLCASASDERIRRRVVASDLRLRIDHRTLRTRTTKARPTPARLCGPQRRHARLFHCSLDRPWLTGRTRSRSHLDLPPPSSPFPASCSATSA